jgi:hypothetical protein
VYFASSLKSFRVRYEKIVAFTPYSDGIGIQRDATTAKPQAFLTGDGWFVYNLVTNVANLISGRDEHAARKTRPRAKTRESTEESAGRFPLAIVGESHYQAALEAICADRDKEGTDRVVDAVLVLEDSNPHDDQAVRVDIDGTTVGYLSRANARRFREVYGPDAEDGRLPCKARIKGGWDRGADDRGSLGVWLSVNLEK